MNADFQDSKNGKRQRVKNKRKIKFIFNLQYYLRLSA